MPDIRQLTTDNPLLFNFTPFPNLETERLLLKRLVKSDAPILWRLRNSEAVMQYIDRPRQKDIKETELFIKHIDGRINANTDINWGIFLKSNPNDLIGTIGYYRNQPENHRGEIGYMLDSNHWRKGIMTEAMRKVIDYGFNEIKFHTIEACINPDNIASREILLKNGFVKEAYYKENYLYKGKFMDSEVYTLFDN
jgi:[ribosomal protein S5]-alanine N-acetyltransferase